jgi:hypothetical protein
MDTVSNVNNVSLEDVFSRSLRLNWERRNRLSNVSVLSIGRLRCVHRLSTGARSFTFFTPPNRYSRLFSWLTDR